MTDFYKSLGTVNDDVNFEYGEDATAHRGCGVVYKGEYLYFGGDGTDHRYGSGDKRQVSSKLFFCLK